MKFLKGGCKLFLLSAVLFSLMLVIAEKSFSEEKKKKNLPIEITAEKMTSDQKSNRVTFFGGVGGVTGSKHLIETEGLKILLDCGTFQGLSDVRERNRGFPFAPDSIDHVVLSHAHIDHSGMLPLLVKRGFTGKVFATAATRDVVELMLEDMARIEVYDSEYRAKKHIGAPDDRVPLFTGLRNKPD